MPDYQSIHSGSQIDSGVTKGLKLPDPVAADAGKLITATAAGGFALSSRVTAITSSATDSEYPTAKAVYNLFASITDADNVNY